MTVPYRNATLDLLSPLTRDDPMARTLEFVFQGQSFTGAIDKVDRASLYGSVDVETRDRAGLKCAIATLAGDGRTLVPSGGTALAYFNPDGRWLERGDLVPVDRNGNRVNSVPSSFDAPIELDMQVSAERFLDHSIRSAYAVDAVAAVPGPLAAKLDSGAIFKLDFSYRGGISTDPAFLMKGADGTLWMLVGDENDFNCVALAQSAGLSTADEPDEAESDDLDFEMM
jgi:hypothetical protein